MKKKFLLFFLPVLTLFSCNPTNNDPYKDKIVKGTENVILNNVDSFKKEYASDETINIGNLTVTFKLDGKETNIEYFNSDDEKIVTDKFFVTTSESAPTLGRIKKNDKLSTSNPTYSLKFYIALIHDDKVYLNSNGIDITIKNSRAVNPVLYYVGTAVIFVAIGVLIYIVQKKKSQG